MFRRFSWLGLFLLQGCFALPLNTARDASLVPPGESRHAAMLASPSIYTTSEFHPTVFGSGSTTEYLYRRGITTGHERAVRIGVSGVPFHTGVYGGVEAAWDMRRGTRGWGTVGYAGAVGGLEGFTATLLPIHKYGQVYAGLIAGRVRGTFRPELNLRVGAQPGLSVWDPYVAGVATVEPRLRAHTGQVSFSFGLGLDAGWLACGDCAFGDERTGKFIYGVHPSIGVSIP